MSEKCICIYTHTRIHQILGIDWMVWRWCVVGRWVFATLRAILRSSFFLVVQLLFATVCTVTWKGGRMFHVLWYGRKCYSLPGNPPFAALSTKEKWTQGNISPVVLRTSQLYIITDRQLHMILHVLMSSSHNVGTLFKNIPSAKCIIVHTYFIAPLTMCVLSMAACCSCCGCTCKITKERGCVVAGKVGVECKGWLTFSKLFMRLMSGESGEKDLVAITGCCLRTSRLAFSRCSTEVIWRLRDIGEK